MVAFLATALSAKGFGFVVMEGQKTIIEFGRRVADGDKNAQSLAKVKKLHTFYRPDALVLQDVEAKGSRRHPRIKRLNRQIKGAAEKHKIKVKLISVSFRGLKSPTFRGFKIPHP